MKHILVFIFLSVSLLSFNSMRSKLLFNFKVDAFDIDVLGNLYLVNETELIKYNSELEKQATFSNLSYGEITSIDASDAMNLLVFYEDFAKVLFLDNTLSLKKSAIDLSDLGFPNASLACLSYNNAFWIFDPVNQELIRINQFLEIGERTGNLNQIINIEIEPNQLFESGDHVYLKDSKKGIFVFDRYGGFLKRMPFLNVDDLQIEGENTLKYLRNDTTFSYNMKSLQSDTTIYEFHSIKKVIPFSNQEGYYYILQKNGELRRQFWIGTPSF